VLNISNKEKKTLKGYRTILIETKLLWYSCKGLWREEGVKIGCRS